MSSRIEDYALIGDCEAAALVSKDGSIDWLCWPRFDSGACFAALLGDSNNGHWRIAPAAAGERANARVRRRYQRNTLILETEFTIADGSASAVLIDFMPLREGRAWSQLVRLVVGMRGTVPMRTELIVRFGYGGWVPWVTRSETGDLLAIAGPDMLLLRTPVELRGEGLTTVGDFTVAAGQRVAFVLAYVPSHLPLPELVDAEDALRSTEEFWRSWASGCRWCIEPHAEIVTRSLITLKALTYAPTGGIIAAPTTSLPERLGGPRNWDYRFCWLRDATLTLLALMNSGYFDEARAFRAWLLRAAAGSPADIQIMYGVAGERWPDEREVPWLSGYENSKPVRVGNAAANQLQLDVYGEVMDAAHHAHLGGVEGLPAAWDFARELLAHLETVWRAPDEGIWEVRSGRHHFTHSKVMAWVAFDRGIKAVEAFGLDGPVDRWRQIRAEIHDEVCRRGFNRELGSFVQTYDSDLLDASTLLIPQVGFLLPDDPRVQGTVAAIERKLLRGGFVLRYDSAAADDGLPPGEGAFLPCSFWLADAYVLIGRNADAQRLFKRLVGLCNDVGLLSEEYDPGAQRLVGNFPQAFSHIALINTAHNVAAATKPCEQRSGNPARRGFEPAYP
ncbi:MAG TPA: glycoside hydrolase family 15 protein [Methylocella sp.]|nr:glycoside hydrolase family 15 protein [Methylocella sp.]